MFSSRVAVFGILCLSVALPLRAQFPAAELRALWPSAAAAGQSVDVTINSSDRMDEASQLLFSHPGITASLKTTPPRPFTEEPVAQFGTFSVSVAADVPPGRYDVRAVGRHGVSNARAFLVSPIPVETVGASHQLDAPTPLELGTVVQTKASGAALDYYQFELQSAQAVDIQFLAQEMDTRMIGYLKLLDQQGRRIEALHGADDVDPRLITTELPPGKYTLAVHDFLYRGGEEYGYQLSIQDVASSVALLGQEGAVPPGPLPTVLSPNACCVDAKLASDEETLDPQSPQPITLPHEGTWWFAPDHQPVIFEFDGQQGQAINWEIVSERRGQLTDARLLLRRLEVTAEGAEVAHDVFTAEDSQGISDGIINLFSTDPIHQITLPQTARYRLVVRDLDVGETLQAKQKFLLRIAEPKPQTRLVAYRPYPHRDNNQVRPHGSKLIRGGCEAIRVFALRQEGAAGPIELKVEGLPEGVTAPNVTLAANQNQTQIHLIASDSAPTNVFSPTIIGTTADGQQIKATPLEICVSKGNGRELLRPRQVTELSMAVVADDVAAISIQLGGNNVVEVKKGEAVSLPVQLTRREGGDQPCVLRPRDLPGGVSVGEITIPGDQSAGNIEVKTTPNTAPGTYSFWLQAETKVKVKPNPQLLDRAQAYRAHLQQLHDDPANAGNLDAIKAAIVEADKMVEAAKGAANPQDLTVFLPSSMATIKVVDP